MERWRAIDKARGVRAGTSDADDDEDDGRRLVKVLRA
jgi:hypothetical protein